MTFTKECFGLFYEVIDKIMDSRDATAGGGSASAVAGAMAAGLVGMVARLSAGKNFGLKDERYEEIADELDGYVDLLRKGAVEDTLSYLGIKDAFALPKSTDEEKATRRKAIEDAAVKAACVPLENGKISVNILRICKEMEGRYNEAAKSDMEAGIMLAKMAAADTALNVEANLPLIKSPEKNTALKREAEKLKEAAANII